MWGRKSVVDHNQDKAPHHGAVEKVEESTADKTGATVLRVNNEFHFRKRITELARKQGISLAERTLVDRKAKPLYDKLQDPQTLLKDIQPVLLLERDAAYARNLIEEMVKNDTLVRLKEVNRMVEELTKERSRIQTEFDRLAKLHGNTERAELLSRELATLDRDLEQYADYKKKLEEPLNKVVARLKVEEPKVRALVEELAKEWYAHLQQEMDRRSEVANMGIESRLLSYRIQMQQRLDHYALDLNKLLFGDHAALVKQYGSIWAFAKLIRRPDQAFLDNVFEQRMRGTWVDFEPAQPAVHHDKTTREKREDVYQQRQAERDLEADKQMREYEKIDSNQDHREEHTKVEAELERTKGARKTAQLAKYMQFHSQPVGQVREVKRHASKDGSVVNGGLFLNYSKSEDAQPVVAQTHESTKRLGK